MRVTQQSQVLAMRADLQQVNSRLAAIQRQVASGRQLDRASDGPAEALEAIRYRRSLRAYDQYDRNLGDAKAWLGAADSTLEAVDGRLTRVRDLTIQADNGSLGPAERATLATELRTIADEMIGLANTDRLGRPIFAGTAGGGQAYATNGTFLGDTNPVNRAVAAGSSYQINAVGPDVFGVDNPGDPANGNLFELIRHIADEVDAGAQVAPQLDAIDTAQTRVHTAQATLGARLASLEKLELRSADSAIDMKSSLSKIEDVDFTEAILDLKGQEAAYTTALSVTARILDQSLLNFLR